jgi:hypothetical protein
MSANPDLPKGLSDEAVEAAAVAITQRANIRTMYPDRFSERERHEWAEDFARHALIAALPHLVRPASDEVWQSMAVGVMNHAVSLLENYGQHHGWCATVKNAAARHTCDCGYSTELWSIQQMRKMAESCLPHLSHSKEHDTEREGVWVSIWEHGPMDVFEDEESALAWNVCRPRPLTWERLADGVWTGTLSGKTAVRVFRRSIVRRRARNDG